MKIRIVAVGLAWTAILCGQSRGKAHHFSWQDYCFNNSASPVCPGHDYAIKKPAAPAKDPAPRSVVTNPSASKVPNATPSLIVVDSIDWRFADPFADALVGINFGGLSASQLARSLITQLGTRQGLGEADIQKIFDGLSGVDQVAVSVRDNRVVVMVTGAVTDSSLPATEAGLKATSVSGSAMLIGHADAVDQAIERITMKWPMGDLARLAEQRQASSEFWVLGSGGLAGPQAMQAGVKRVSLTVSLRDRLLSDLAFEFNEVPSAANIRTWQTTLGDATVEGKSLHVRTLMEGDELKQKFGEIAAGPLGQSLAPLLQAGRYLPARDTTVPKRTKPVIYGLDGGPREVN